MNVPPVFRRFTEADWLRHLIGKRRYRGTEREGGLLRYLGVGPIFHDEATNAPRCCTSCGADLPVLRNPPGFPDLVFVAGSTLWLVELKTDRGRTTPPQQAWIDALRSVTRVRVAVWRPRDLETIVYLLREGGVNTP